MKSEEEEEGGSHVLIFPCAAQGHVNSMLKLAELLSLPDNNLHVTFLTTHNIHLRLMSLGHIQARLERYPKLQFKSIPDGLHEDHPVENQLWIVSNWLKEHAKPLFRDILLSSSTGKPKISCLIVDGYLAGFTTDVADELGIPIIHFRTVSACCFWAYFCAPKLFQFNELPIKGEEDMDRVITNIPGMENLLRCRDLPSFFRERDTDQISLSSVVFETQQNLRAKAVILNTFEDLEGPVLSQMRLHFPKLYTLGPLHALLNSKKQSSSSPCSHKPPSSSSSSTNLWEVDRSCISWLDSQPSRSVIYVSFGSITVMKRDELMEIWHGLVNSKKRFLWVIRPDMVAAGDGSVPAELVEGTKERGFIVGWAPQEEVLAHWAVSGFLTHGGWNSILESVVSGVAMICWPYFADQQINSRMVGEVWKVGLDMKDVCEREVVTRMVNDVMVDRNQEFFRSVQDLGVLARKTVAEAGSSYNNLLDLVQYIKSTAQSNCYADKC